MPDALFANFASCCMAILKPMRRQIACPTLVLDGGAKGHWPSRLHPRRAPDETVRALGEVVAGDEAP